MISAVRQPDGSQPAASLARGPLTHQMRDRTFLGRASHKLNPFMRKWLVAGPLVLPWRAFQANARPLAGLRVQTKRLLTTARAVAKTAVCLFKVYPMLPSRPLNWVTPRPVIERFAYPSSRGPGEGDLYRPASRGPHPGVVVCLGVVPFDVDQPQVPRLGEALARSGFAALLYWSPAMRRFRLEPADVVDIASACNALLARADVDPARSGLLGTCVGGAFAVMAAADPRVRDRVGFVCAYAPYASMWTLARDIASASRRTNGVRAPWAVDPLTWKVYVHSVTALLEPEEAARLRSAFAERHAELVGPPLSDGGQAVLPLLTVLDADEAEAALRALPTALQERLIAMSPVRYLADIRAPLIVLLHDRDDPVIPVSESRQLRDALAGRSGLHYTEFTVFKHLDPTKGKPAAIPLARELVRFGQAIYPLFRRAVSPTEP
jgi:dienelactone hydrolase